MSKKFIEVDEQKIEGGWYGDNAAILKTNGHWQAVEVEITGKGEERKGVSGRLIGYPQNSVKDAQGQVNEYNARKVMDNAGR